MAPWTLHDPPAFYSNFLTELRRHGYPSYGERLWSIALRIAVDLDDASLREAVRQTLSHQLDAQYYDEFSKRERYRLGKSVGLACSAWLLRHNA